jgi:zinc/manganese transport system substrate-binding protein
MQRRVLLTSLLTLPIAALAAPSFHAVASFSILGDMLRQTGGDLVQVTALVPADADVHTWHPRPADLRAVVNAQLLVRNGLGLEGWMDRIQSAAGFTGIVVTTTDGITPRLLGAHPDPHAWQDPRNGIIYVGNIIRGLVKADPRHAGAYQKTGAEYAAGIHRTDEWIAAQIEPIPRQKRRIITSHDAFGYYGARYGITFLAAEGISTDAEPSAKSIAALVRQIRQEKVTTVFLEIMTDPRIARMLARESGAKVGPEVYSDALSPSDGPAATYLDMLRYNTTLFVQAMRGE